MTVIVNLVLLISRCIFFQNRLKLKTEYRKTHYKRKSITKCGEEIYFSVDSSREQCQILHLSCDFRGTLEIQSSLP